jgi:formylglycine-generating enzyme required for sulfatase activity
MGGVEFEDPRIVPSAAEGLSYAWIPAGRFLMGCVPGDTLCDADEKPRHTVRFASGFWITTTEINVASFERFVSATGGIMPTEPAFNPGWKLKNHPIVNVTLPQAAAYCRWAGARLPSEAEWEYASRGGFDGRRYPWGDTCEERVANLSGMESEDHWAHTAPVGSFPANEFGLHDMSGNVWEWVEDGWHDGYEGAPADGAAWGIGRVTEPGEAAAVLRGGSWRSGCRQLRSSHRGRWFWPGDRFDDYGFRCIREQAP